VGYNVPHGTSIEPPAVVVGNKFESVGFGPREENLRDLEYWAYDVITRRTTGTKIYGAAAWSKALRWAKNLKAFFENEDNYTGYAIIVPEFERIFGTGRYFDEVCSKLISRMDLQDEAPF
jgi:hypothetical protein